MTALKIYLSDLTHDTVGPALEIFPLNIGYIGAYCKKVHGSKVELTLFKDIKKLESAIRNDPPDILGASNYPWCHRIDLAMFKILADVRPEPRLPQRPGFSRTLGRMAGAAMGVVPLVANVVMSDDGLEREMVKYAINRVFRRN